MIELEMDLQIKFVPFVGFLFEMERVDQDECMNKAFNFNYNEFKHG